MNTLEISELLRALGEFNSNSAKLLHELNETCSHRDTLDHVKLTLLTVIDVMNRNTGKRITKLCGTMSDKH